MAGSIKDIKIQIGADVSPLNRALSGVNKEARSIQSELNKVNKLLKLDPKNVELLGQKQKLLQEQVSNTKKKLEELKLADEQAKQQLANGEISEGAYRDLQRTIVETEQNLKKFEEQLEQIPSKADKVFAGINSAGEKMKSVGTNLTLGITAPIAGIATASMAAFNEVDAGLDTIVTKTGATGDALDGLNDVFDEVFTSLPVDAQSAGDAVGELNTQFGLTGDALADASKAALEFAEINGVDVTSSIQGAKGAMEAMNVPADQYVSFLDAANKAGQDTGVSMDKLFQVMRDGAEPLKSLGLSYEESAQMIGRFEQSGVDSSKALNYLSKAQVVATKSGKDFGTELQNFVDMAKNGTDQTELMTKATELFGTRGANEMIKAAKNGALSLDDLAKAAEGSAGSVEGAFEGTLDPIDQMTTVMNNLKSAGNELAGAIQEAAAPMLQELANKAKELAKWFKGLSPETKRLIVIIGGIAAAVGPAMVALGSTLTTIVKIRNGIKGLKAASDGLKAAKGISSFAKAFTLLNPTVLIVVGVVAAIAGLVLIIKHLWETNETFRNIVTGAWNAVKDAIGGAIDFIGGLVDGIGKGFSDAGKTIGDFFGGIGEAAAGAPEAISNGLSGIGDKVSSAFEGAGKVVSSAMDNIKQNAANRAGEITDRINERLMPEQSITEKMLVVSSAVVSGLGDMASDSVQTVSNMAADVAEKMGFPGAADAIRGFGDKVSEGIQRVTDFVDNGLNIIRAGFSSFREHMQNVGQAISDFFNGKIDISEALNRIMQSLTDFFGAAVDLVAEQIANIAQLFGFDDAAENIRNFGATAEEAIHSAMSAMRTKVSEATSAIKETIGSKFNEAKSKVSEVWNGVKSSTSESWSNIKSKISETAGNIQSNLAEKFGSVQSDMGSKFGSMVSTAGEKFNSIKEKMQEPIARAKEFIGEKISAIKSFFSNLQLKIPTPKLPKLPHFSIKWGSVMGVSYPAGLNVEWYAKGGIFKRPAILAGANGGMYGVAEPSTGGEAVLPLKELVPLMADALKQAGVNSRGNIVINVDLMSVRNKDDIRNIAIELDKMRRRKETFA